MSDRPDPLKLANLMCSRLCHDLTSPIGAVNSALELMADDYSNGVDPDVFVLLMRSAGEASGRLAFFRTAFGDGGGADAELSCDRLEGLARGILPTGKITLDWDVGEMVKIQNRTGKLLLIFVLVAVEALPRGGNISVRAHILEEGIDVACIAEGPGAGLKENIAAALSGSCDPETISARDVSAFYANILATSANGTIETSSDEGAVMLAALLP